MANNEREYLVVPYGEHKLARAAGAWWDRAAKLWFVGVGADREKLRKWMKSDPVASSVDPAIEFADALRDMGCIVEGKHPVMDGEIQRIATDGDKGKETAGLYVAYLDKHPAGFIKNYRTGEELRWSASRSGAMNPEERVRQRAQMDALSQYRATQRKKEREATADRVRRQLDSLELVKTPTPYMKAKGIRPQRGAFVDKKGETTYIPAIDIDGKQWTMQYIQADGTKRFAKNGRKTGCFHPVGGLRALKDAPALVVAEGYATAVTLYQSLGYTVSAAFDAGNLDAVVTALAQRYPEKPVFIAADDDQYRMATIGKNPGREKAEAVAEKVSGVALFPVFAPGESPRTDPSLTDFNDLVMNSAVGVAGVERQVVETIRDHIERLKSKSRNPIMANEHPDAQPGEEQMFYVISHQYIGKHQSDLTIDYNNMAFGHYYDIASVAPMGSDMRGNGEGWVTHVSGVHDSLENAIQDVLEATGGSHRMLDPADKTRPQPDSPDVIQRIYVGGPEAENLWYAADWLDEKGVSSENGEVRIEHAGPRDQDLVIVGAMTDRELMTLASVIEWNAERDGAKVYHTIDALKEYRHMAGGAVRDAATENQANTAFNIVNQDAVIVVDAPANHWFAREAHIIGGKFTDAVWLFDQADEARVRALCHRVYGCDGSDAAERVNLQVTWPQEAALPAVFEVCGRKVVGLASLDSDAISMGSSAQLVSGSIRAKRQGVNRMVASAGATVSVANIPKRLALEMASRTHINGATYSIADSQNSQGERHSGGVATNPGASRPRM